MADLWHREFVAGIPTYMPEVGEAIRVNGNRYRPYDMLHMSTGPYCCHVYDAAEADGLYQLTQAISGWKPNVAAMPWRRDWTGAPGGDGLAVVNDYVNGYQWSIGKIPWYSPHKVTRRLIATDAGAAIVPTWNPERNRVEDLVDSDGNPVLADLRVTSVAAPKCGGAGVGLRPAEQSWFDNEDVPTAFSLYCSATTLGSRSLVVSPASKVENVGKRNTPSFGGVRVSFEFDWSDLADLMRPLRGVEARDFRTTMRAMSSAEGRGGSVDATGPRFSIVCAQNVAIRPDLLAGVLSRVKVNVHVPPWAILPGLPPTQGVLRAVHHTYKLP